MHPESDPAADADLITVKPGEVYVTDKNETIYTVLGSCVAVCLMDPLRRIGGLNHFALPEKPDSAQQLETEPIGRYGETAMPLLVDAVVRQGARRSHLIAHLFGGASTVTAYRNSTALAAENIRLAEMYLAAARIPIHGRHTGGTCTMRVYFHVPSGEIRVESISRNKLASREARIFSSDIPRMLNGEQRKSAE